MSMNCVTSAAPLTPRNPSTCRSSLGVGRLVDLIELRHVGGRDGRGAPCGHRLRRERGVVLRDRWVGQPRQLAIQHAGEDGHDLGPDVRGGHVAAHQDGRRVDVVDRHRRARREEPQLGPQVPTGHPEGVVGDLVAEQRDVAVGHHGGGGLEGRVELPDDLRHRREPRLPLALDEGDQRRGGLFERHLALRRRGGRGGVGRRRRDPPARVVGPKERLAEPVGDDDREGDRRRDDEGGSATSRRRRRGRGWREPGRPVRRRGLGVLRARSVACHHLGSTVLSRARAVAGAPYSLPLRGSGSHGGRCSAWRTPQPPARPIHPRGCRGERVGWLLGRAGRGWRPRRSRR